MYRGFKRAHKGPGGLVGGQIGYKNFFYQQTKDPSPQNFLELFTHIFWIIFLSGSTLANFSGGTLASEDTN